MRDLSCTEAVRRLWDYLDHALREPDAEDVRRHLAECAGCRAHEEFERRLLREIVALRREPGDLTTLRDRIARALAREGVQVDQRDA